MNKILHYMHLQDLRGKISFTRILWDILWCNLLYGTTISDYFSYRFYQKKRCEKKTFMTAKDKDVFYKRVNAGMNSTERQAIQNKNLFNEKFADYLKRESINSPQCGYEVFLKFLNLHQSVFVKPTRTGGGYGIEKFSLNDVEDTAKLWNDIVKKGECVIEAPILQHPHMAALHPQSINSLRIASFLNENEVTILFAVLRCGVGDSFVDNHSSGGIAMAIDIESGKVCSQAASKSKTHIIRHPDTGVFLPGFQIPFWNECLELIKEVAKKAKGIRYVGWDIAIMPDGICLIEANPGGDFDVAQEPMQKGIKETITRLI